MINTARIEREAFFRFMHASNSNLCPPKNFHINFYAKNTSDDFGVKERETTTAQRQQTATVQLSDLRKERLNRYFARKFILIN